MTDAPEEKTAAETFIAAVEAEWPITNLMGHEFYCMVENEERVGAVCLELSDEDDNIVNLDLVKVTRGFRGMGYGTKILNRICDLADQHFVALEIGIQPDGTVPHMDIAALTAMYERRGFEVIEKTFSFQDTDGPRMSRSPQPEKRIGFTI